LVPLIALTSRGAGDGINTNGSTQFGVMPCPGAKWGKVYLDRIAAFSEYAGLGVFESDGSYPGDTCATTGTSKSLSRQLE
jgi:hypothetical protein